MTETQSPSPNTPPHPGFAEMDKWRTDNALHRMFRARRVPLGVTTRIFDMSKEDFAKFEEDLKVGRKSQIGSATKR